MIYSISRASFDLILCLETIWQSIFETMILMILYNDDVNCFCRQRLPSSPSHSASSGGSSRGSWTLRRLMESPPPQLLGECRPRSCVDSVSGSADLAATARKRWSVNLGGKLIQAYDRLGDDTEEEYTDRYSPLLCLLLLYF